MNARDLLNNNCESTNLLLTAQRRVAQGELTTGIMLAPRGQYKRMQSKENRKFRFTLYTKITVMVNLVGKLK